MQLGIRDVLKKGQAETFLTKSRKLAQHLRSPHTDGILKRRTNKGMLKDMPKEQNLSSQKRLSQNLSKSQKTFLSSPSRCSARIRFWPGTFLSLH